MALEKISAEKGEMITVDTSKLFECDEDFVVLIKELNRVGLKTTQCCAGHSENNSDSYISIDMSNCDVWIRDIDNKVRLVIRWNRFGKKLYS